MLLSKVPEVTVWFWVIKILCTTVGESFADWINMTLGVGLIPTALIFTVVLAAVLGWQLSLNRYVPFVYWLTVVVLSVTGTLYTDILTDNLGVPLALSTSVFAAILAVVFGVWFARERTLSIHSIVTRRRELFYWLAVLVTFALGTAAGDWILELTGWGPGTSVLLPAGSDRRDRDRLATRRERCAVLLARVHSDPPAGCEPRRLVGVAAGPTGPRFGCCPHQRGLPHRDPRNCPVPDTHSRRCDRRDRAKPRAGRNRKSGSRADHARVLRRCRRRLGRPALLGRRTAARNRDGQRE